MSSGSGNRRARSILEKFIRQPKQPHDHDSSDEDSPKTVLNSLEVSKQPLESVSVSDSVISPKNSTLADFTPDAIVNVECLPWSGLESFFIFKGIKGNNIIAKCVLCGPSGKEISTAKNTPSNLKRHIMLK